MPTKSRKTQTKINENTSKKTTTLNFRGWFKSQWQWILGVILIPLIAALIQIAPTLLQNLSQSFNTDYNETPSIGQIIVGENDSSKLIEITVINPLMTDILVTSLYLGYSYSLQESFVLCAAPIRYTISEDIVIRADNENIDFDAEVLPESDLWQDYALAATGYLRRNGCFEDFSLQFNTSISIKRLESLQIYLVVPKELNGVADRADGIDDRNIPSPNQLNVTIHPLGINYDGGFTVRLKTLENNELSFIYRP